MFAKKFGYRREIKPEFWSDLAIGIANMTPKETIVPSAVEVKGETIAGDPTATGEIIDFYQPNNRIYPLPMKGIFVAITVIN